MKNEKRIAILGAGGIGRAVALILAEWGDEAYDLFIGDAYPETAKAAEVWIKEGMVESESTVTSFVMPKEGSSEELENVLRQCQVVLDCLPGSQAPRVARLAKQFGLHYANLTEYVQETNDIVEIAKDATTGFVLQAGLAPGYINILANDLYQGFCEDYGVKKVEYIGMKVGALSQNARAPHFYGFTWSPIGVATEYVKNAWVLRDYQKTEVPALSERQTIILDGGMILEEDLTSGGAADLPETFTGIARRLDYKTLRYPGHYAWVQEQLDKTPLGEDKIQHLQKAMEKAVPHLEDDVVVIYACVEGYDKNGVLRSREATQYVYPQLVGSHTLRAIQTTTAAPLAECARMLLDNKWRGVVYQSQIDPQDFLTGTFVAQVFNDETEEALW